MKKCLLFLFALVMLTGCGSKQEWAENIEKGTRLSKCPLLGDEFYVEYKETNPDMEMHGNLVYTIAISGDKVATTDYSGKYKNYIIVDEKGTHIVNDEFKVVMERPGNISSINKDVFNLRLVGNFIKEDEEDGLTYEQYYYDTNYINFYFDEDDNLVKIKKSYNQSKSTIDIVKLTKDIPKDAFEIPKDYTVDSLGMD